MKQLLIVLLVAACQAANARIITVSNMPTTPAEFSSVLLALGSAAPNDTIYVHGSDFNYGAITLNRPGLVLIGTGHDPQKQFPLVSAFTDIDIIADNCQVIGIVFNRINVGFPNFRLARCKILGSFFGAGIQLNPSPPRNILVESNVFTGVEGNANISYFEGNGDVVIIRNNIFSGLIDNPFSGSIPSTYLVANNIFLHGPIAFTFIDHATIRNNIFQASAPIVPVSATLVIENNITYLTLSDIFMAGTNIVKLNNLEGVNPQFVNYPSGPDKVYSFLEDYHLAPGSPGLASGSDGTDRGVYGGFGTIFDMAGEPPIAEISAVTITSPTTVAPGGTLSVTITTRRVH